MLDSERLPTIGEVHLMQRAHLTDRHCVRMEQLLSENAHKEKYWILGTVMCKRKKGKTIIKPFLKACDEQPEVKKESYLYEVDNIAKTKTLLWVMHPNGKLSMPVIGKSIHVADESGV